MCNSKLKFLSRLFLSYQHPSIFNHLVQVIQLLCEKGQISLSRDLKQHLTYLKKKKYSKHLSFTELTCFSCPEKTNISLRCTHAVFQHFHFHWHQTWNLSKILHRRICRLKNLHRQFHLILTVLVRKKHKK